jgi:hypothetical protein
MLPCETADMGFTRRGRDRQYPTASLSGAPTLEGERLDPLAVPLISDRDAPVFPLPASETA